jgi:hypothetical protein
VRDAATLFQRAGADVTLYIPWVSVSEAKRTITMKNIKEDLGFADLVKKFGVKLLKNGLLTPAEMQPIQSFEKRLKDAQFNALKTVEADVDAAVAKMNVIPPSPGVVAKTMTLYPIKYLPLFDEMVLGAVIFRAQELFYGGITDLFFCNANTKDFSPTSGNTLGAAYAACGLTFLSDFKVP